MHVPFVDLKAQHRDICDEIRTAIDEVLGTMHLVLGPQLAHFESEFAAYVGAEHAIGVGSGTDALYLALRACNVGLGDEVITVANTFIATAEAIALTGATAVFVDVDPETQTLDPARLEAAIGPRSRAVIPVHLFGQMADMHEIMLIARRHGLVVIEDACQAHGATQRGRRAGSIGDAAAFSFYPSKNLGAYGEGGAVTTSSSALADRVRLLRDHGSQCKYEHTALGVNSRLDELQAAVLRVKLRHLENWNERRRAHADAYHQLLERSGVGLPVVRAGDAPAFHLYVITTDGRDQVRQALADRGVATGIHYPIPIHQQVAARGVTRISGDLRATEALTGRILSLPMYAELQPEQLEHVATSLQAAIDGRSSLALAAR